MRDKAGSAAAAAATCKNCLRGRFIAFSPPSAAHVGHFAWARSAAAASLASCTTLPWSSAVNLPDWRKMRPPTMTVSTLVDTVIVDGRILRQSGKFTALDHGKVVHEAKEAAA